MAFENINGRHGVIKTVALIPLIPIKEANSHPIKYGPWNGVLSNVTPFDEGRNSAPGRLVIASDGASHHVGEGQIEHLLDIPLRKAIINGLLQPPETGSGIDPGGAAELGRFLVYPQQQGVPLWIRRILFQKSDRVPIMGKRLPFGIVLLGHLGRLERVINGTVPLPRGHEVPGHGGDDEASIVVRQFSFKKPGRS